MVEDARDGMESVSCLAPEPLSRIGILRNSPEHCMDRTLMDEKQDLEMSYPPTPDPFSAPSTRRNPSQTQPSDGDSHAHSDLSSPPPNDDASFASANSRNYFGSSADHYAPDPDPTQHADVSGELYTRVPSTSDQIRIDSRGINNPAAGRKSSEVLLTPPTSDNHPLFTPPLSNDGFVPVGQEPRSTDRNGSSAHFDPYSRYSSANFSTVTSNADYSDDDSQRVLHRNDGSNGSGRRGSNLAAYDSAMDYQVKDERSGIISGGEKLRKRPPPVGNFWTRQSPRAKKFLIFLLVLAIIIIAVVAGTVSSMVRRNAGSRSNAANENEGTPTTAPVQPDTGVVPDAPSVPTGRNTTINWRTAASGGNGSTVYTADGSSFIYNSTFGQSFLPALCPPLLTCVMLRWILERHSVQQHRSGATRHSHDCYSMFVFPYVRLLPLVTDRHRYAGDYSRNRIYGVNVGGCVSILSELNDLLTSALQMAAGRALHRSGLVRALQYGRWRTGHERRCQRRMDFIGRSRCESRYDDGGALQDIHR